MQISQEGVEQLIFDCFDAIGDRSGLQIIPLKGDASSRTIFRLSKDDKSWIGVYGPNVSENRAFLGFTRTFRDQGYPVPQVYSVDTTGTAYILEDLGDTTLFSYLNQLRDTRKGRFPEREILSLYERAIRQLVRFQRDALDQLDWGLCYQTREFGNEAWKKDQQYFLEKFLGSLTGFRDQVNQLDDEMAYLRHLLEQYPLDGFIYRDFQSRNIMIRNGDLWFIDYQSGRKGFGIYDVASLLVDSRADLPEHFRERILHFYADLMSKRTGNRVDYYLEAYKPFALLRILQVLGSYGNNALIRGKYEHLASIPFAIENAGRYMANEEIFAPMQKLGELMKRLANEKPWTDDCPCHIE